MGRDGARGAGKIKAGGGAVFVENPGKSSSPSMSQTASTIANVLLPLEMIGDAITDQVTLSNKKLWNRKKQK